LSSGANPNPGTDNLTPRQGVVMPSPTDIQMGSFYLIREVGHGAMGEVWLGYDPSLRRNVAIKMMRCEVASEEVYVARFKREAQAVARLNHPHIVHIHSIGEDQGTLYLVMEWVDGPTLSSQIRREGAIPRKEALRIVRQCAEALEYAWQQGITHRDIKPGNIMLTGQKHAKITDFGLAKLTDCETQMTRTGTPMGTPDYMSPEACRGEELDWRSDLYSLGITLYHMLTGAVPFTSATPMTVMYKHVHEPLPEPPVLSQVEQGIWVHVLRRMTSKNKDDRYRTYSELLEALDQLQHASSGQMTPFPDFPAPGVQSGSYSALSLPTGVVTGTSATTPYSIPTVPPGGNAGPGFLQQHGKKIGVAAGILLIVIGGVFVLDYLGDSPSSGPVTHVVEATPVASPVTVAAVSPPTEAGFPSPEASTPSPPAGQPGVPPDESNQQHAADQSADFNRLLSMVGPEARTAYESYDFQKLYHMIGSATTSSPDPTVKELAARFVEPAKELSSFRTDVAKLVQKSPEFARFKRGATEYQVTAVSDTALQVTGADGKALEVKWAELLPHELLGIWAPIVDGPYFRPKMDALGTIYPRFFQDVATNHAHPRPGLALGGAGGPAGGGAGQPGLGQGQRGAGGQRPQGGPGPQGAGQRPGGPRGAGGAGSAAGLPPPQH